MAAIFSALALESQNSVSLCMSKCLPSCCLAAGTQGEFLGVRQSVCLPFMKMPEFSAAICLTLMNRIPADFHSDLLWWLLFLALVLCVGEPGVGLGPLTSVYPLFL